MVAMVARSFSSSILSFSCTIAGSPVMIVLTENSESWTNSRPVVIIRASQEVDNAHIIIDVTPEHNDADYSNLLISV